MGGVLVFLITIQLMKFSKAGSTTHSSVVSLTITGKGTYSNDVVEQVAGLGYFIVWKLVSDHTAVDKSTNAWKDSDKSWRYQPARGDLWKGVSHLKVSPRKEKRFRLILTLAAQSRLPYDHSVDKTLHHKLQRARSDAMDNPGQMKGTQNVHIELI